ncbi:hypothetical protein [Cupriavidus necator]|uniref:hypothetical protein n=1 Tax=Cupriavidus necator TaxID=106590 RepID=UPI00339D4419
MTTDERTDNEQPEDLRTKDLRERMITLIKVLGTDDYGRYTWLAKRTGVPAQKWANLFNRRQQPTVEMIQAVSKLDPRYTEWLVTGEAPALFPQDPFDGINKSLNDALLYNPSARRDLYLQAAQIERQFWESDLAPKADAWNKYLDEITAPGLRNVEERLRAMAAEQPPKTCDGDKED